VTAVRAFLDEKRRVSRREKEEVGVAEPLLDLPSGDDWELDFLKQHYREAFKLAFADAVAGLTSEERNILRFHAVEGLSIDQIGTVYAMHRSSVARRLQGARRALLEATRAGLVERIRVERTELDSIMGLIQSRLDVSLDRLLAPSRAGAKEGTR
jgi:RNA polymerase sigma-70 factor (ECF subfamily)